MMFRLSLTVRAFLFSFLPVCIVLACCFLAVNAVVHDRIREELREQLETSDQLLDHVNADWSKRTSILVSKLADTSGLKAAVGLLAEGRPDSATAAQVHQTIEAQLRELAVSSSFDLLAVADLTGHTVAAVNSTGGNSIGPSIPIEGGMAEVDHQLYHLTSVPIDIGGDPAAILVFGTKFDITRVAGSGHAALVHSGRVIASTLPGIWNHVLEQQLASNCQALQGSCEASLGGQTYVVSSLQKTQLGRGYRLFGFRPLDAPVRQFTQSFAVTLAAIALAGVVLALLSTIVTAYSVSRPLRTLVAQLNHTDGSGDMSGRLTTGKAVGELALLADAYNRVADSAQRARQQLEAAKDAAQCANRLKDEFLTNISHELRTPLNGVLGMTELLLETPLDEEQQEFALTVRNSGEALTTIIDDILTFSQLQTGRLELGASRFDFKTLLNDCERSITRQAHRKDLRVEMFYPDFMPRTFIGPEMHLRQVLRHLGDNAVKFTAAGFIRISFDCKLDSIRALATITVEDSGIGIRPESQQLIFERFTQEDGSLTRQHGGTGLGLALVKGLITLMQGNIDVHSVPGAGSRFRFTVPLTVEHNPGINLPVLARTGVGLC